MKNPGRCLKKGDLRINIHDMNIQLFTTQALFTELQKHEQKLCFMEDYGVVEISIRFYKKNRFKIAQRCQYI